jgi:hypothetical protein
VLVIVEELDVLKVASIVLKFAVELLKTGEDPTVGAVGP